MSDDDVEMEFISVMGVLVPMEVTKGVSEEAWRFVGSSGDEIVDISEANLEVQKPTNRKKKSDEPTEPISGKSKIKVKQAKRKSNLGAKTAEKQAPATTKKKTTGVESNVNPVPEEKERDPTGGRLSRDPRENLRRKQSTEVNAKPDLSSPAVESKQPQKQSSRKARPANLESIDADLKSNTEWIPKVQTVGHKEKPSNGKLQSNSAERGGRTQTCKPRRTKTREMRAKTQCETPPVDNQSKKNSKKQEGGSGMSRNQLEQRQKLFVGAAPEWTTRVSSLPATERIHPVNILQYQSRLSPWVRFLLLLLSFPQQHGKESRHTSGTDEAIKR
ncbi:hypothetical protein PHYPSEUDO_012721 [Phytophthora pseudosyringae]|uniref:Uncharacterized protein n=1 Tax=Phytophthora pseudosyringae TaxID=221518 RepID=A0A8T1W872_9STRA|nr:hypothetical protein PHYPSEUDO_012721 [Phytophthora pseudosyringae]